MPKASPSKPDILPSKLDAEKFVELAGGEDEALFFLAWIKNGLNASKAYRELHPDVTAASAGELGHRMLKRVDKAMILNAYDLGHERYFQQLSAGLNAIKIDPYSGKEYDDHLARKPYHDKLGKLLGIEQDKALISITQNTQNNYYTIESFMAAMQKRREDAKEDGQPTTQPPVLGAEPTTTR